MENIRIAHMADFHINSPLSGFDEEKAKIRRHELIEAFENAVEAAVEEQADIIVIAGDLFDNGDSPRTAEHIIKTLSQCGLPVFIAAGNHDPLDEVYSKIKNHENIHVFSDTLEYVRFDGVRIYGASFPTKNAADLLCTAPQKTDDIHILVMHGDVENGAYNPMKREYLRAFDYCALGHIHAFSGAVTEGESTWAYPGFCEPRGFDEQGEGGIIIADVKKGYTQIKRRIISKRQYIRLELDISDCKDNLDIIDKLQENISTDNIYSITLKGADGSFAVNCEYIQKCIEVYCFDIEVKAEKPRDYEREAAADTLRGRFASHMLRLDNPKAKRALEIGLNAFDRAGDNV